MPTTEEQTAAAPETAAASSSTPDPLGATPPEDARAIAASVFQEASGETEAGATPPATPSAPSETPVSARADGEAEEYDEATLASGSMPLHRHKAVLTNARNKTRAEVEAEYRQRYGYVDELRLDPQRARHAAALLDAFERDPQATLRILAQQLGVASQLGPEEAQEPAGPPPPDITLEDGSTFYSAPQLQKLMEWKERQIEQRLQQLDSRYRPIQERLVLAELQQQAYQQTAQTLAECRAQWPQFTALEQDIKALMVADPTLTLERAYIQAFTTAGLPKLQESWQTDRASQLKRKAAAATLQPGAARPVTPRSDRDKTTREIAAEVMSGL